MTITHAVNSAKQASAAQPAEPMSLNASCPSSEVAIEAAANSMLARPRSSPSAVRWCSSARTASR